MKTTAAVLVQCGAPLQIESEIDIPPLGPGQLLVWIAYSGVCRSQVMETRGLRGEDRYLPHMLGHEGSGEVLQIGPGVTKLAAEHLCVLYATNWGVPTASLRYFTVYGPRQRPDMAHHRLIECAMDQTPFPMFGDGAQERAFTYVGDNFNDAASGAALS